MSNKFIGFNSKYAKRFVKGKRIGAIDCDQIYTYIYFTDGSYLRLLLDTHLKHTNSTTAVAWSELITIGFDKHGNCVQATDKD